MGFLPWEKWLPAWLFGPLLCVGPLLLLVYSKESSWWEFLVLPIMSIVGAFQFVVWVRTGRNIFRDDLPGAPPFQDSGGTTK